jgi:hypothetical protein
MDKIKQSDYVVISTAGHGGTSSVREWKGVQEWDDWHGNVDLGSFLGFDTC